MKRAMGGLVSAVILTGGSGSRFGGEIPKQFVKIAGKTIIEHTLDRFQCFEHIDEIILVVHPAYIEFIKDIVLRNQYHKVKKVLNGGSTRQRSSYLGLQGCDPRCDRVLIHDAVRPFVSERIVNECINALDYYDAVDVAIPTSDTIIESISGHTIAGIPERSNLMRGQTPQAFRINVIKTAHELAVLENGDEALTDDCGLILKYGLGEVRIVQGEEKNFKITNPTDIFVADKIFQLNSVHLNNFKNLNDLRGKVIVIYGHTGGIGNQINAIASALGAKTYGFSRSNGINIEAYDNAVDSLAHVFLQEKSIDYVVNAAAIMQMGALAAKTVNEILEEISINYLGSINIVKASIGFLSQSKGSIALFTSSSYTRGRAFYSIYSSTKAAIVNFVQAMAEELIVKQIRINAINPERTATPMRLKNFGAEPAETLLTPEEVAYQTLQVLLSPLSGQIIDIRKTMNDLPGGDG